MIWRLKMEQTSVSRSEKIKRKLQSLLLLCLYRPTTKKDMFFRSGFFFQSQFNWFWGRGREIKSSWGWWGWIREWGEIVKTEKKEFCRSNSSMTFYLGWHTKTVDWMKFCKGINREKIFLMFFRKIMSRSFFYFLTENSKKVVNERIFFFDVNGIL